MYRNMKNIIEEEEERERRIKKIWKIYRNIQKCIKTNPRKCNCFKNRLCVEMKLEVEGNEYKKLFSLSFSPD